MIAAAQVAALVLAALFTGAAFYINLVEQPARLRLDDEPMLAQWQPSYRLALPLQASLAIAGGLAGLIAWLMSAGPVWLVGSVALLANWPFTLLVIMPVNKRLQAALPAAAGPGERELLGRWGRLHAVRSGLGVAAALCFGAGMIADLGQ